MPQQMQDAPELPPLAAHVWKWWCELHEDREQTELGPKRITHRDITEWSQGFGMPVRAWERRAIRKIDTAFMTPKADDEEAEQ